LHSAFIVHIFYQSFPKRTKVTDLFGRLICVINLRDGHEFMLQGRLDNVD